MSKLMLHISDDRSNQTISPLSWAALMLENWKWATRSHAHHATHGLLTKYVKLWVARAPGMLGTISPPLKVSDPDMHQGMCVMHVPWCMPGSRTSGFLWSRWGGKRSRHSRRMRTPQFHYLVRGPWYSLIPIKRCWREAVGSRLVSLLLAEHFKNWKCMGFLYQDHHFET